MASNLSGFRRGAVRLAACAAGLALAPVAAAQDGGGAGGPSVVEELRPTKGGTGEEGGGAADPGAGADHEAAKKAGETFRIGLVPRGDAQDFVAALSGFDRGLEAALERPVEIVAFPSYTALIDAHVLRRVDAAFYSASAYAVADRLCGCLEPLVAPAAPDGTTAYHGIIVVRRDSGLRGVEDLKGRRVATAAPDSVAGRHVQLAALADEGVAVETHFGEVADVGSSARAVRLVLEGAADAAFAWSSLAGDAEAGYSRGTLRELVGAGELDMADIEVVWRSKPLSHGPFAVMKSLDDDEKAVLRAHLAGLMASDPASYDLLERRYGGGYEAVEAAAYAGSGVLARETVEPKRRPSEPLLPRPRPEPPVL